jgi:carboxyl-terminal processing protease
MPSSRHRNYLRRNYVVVPLFIAACSLAVGLVSGTRAHAATAADDPVSKSLQAFTKVYDAVEQNAADPVKADKSLYNGAIPGMLRTLDPHSNFFDPKAYQGLRDDQRGQYYGIGMQVGARNGKTIVIYPFGGSPAYRAGLHPGDAILQVNDKSTTNLNTTEIADLLKGPRGTKVTVLVGRDGVDMPISFTLTRDSIPRFSVPDAFYLKAGIAYVDVTGFNENTSKELDDKLKKLNEKDIKGLVLDLRGNPGGLLNEGVDVASHFLKRGDLVVSHHGRASPNKNYQARSDGSGKDYPIVVIVNRNSASAAEIVSGALQDHDRAWILGETTFGKGLVQTVFPLGENTGLALTTAHYYTPSGRLIQRDYSNISFLDYYTHTNLNQKNMSDVKMTDSGRTVYGGGGITPDEKFDSAKLNKFQIAVLRKYGFFAFSAHYFGVNTAKLPKGWEPDENIVNQFHEYLLKNGVEFTEAEFTENHQWVKEQLKREMYITGFSVEDSQRVGIEQDPEVQRAIEAMPKAKALLETAKKQLVQRMNGQDAPALAARR